MNLSSNSKVISLNNYLRLFTILLAIVAVNAVSSPLLAAGDSTEGSEDTTNQNLNELISLLENPEAREAFLDKVKALEEARAEVQPDRNLELSDALEIDEKVGTVVQRYIDMATDTSFQAGRLGNVVTGVALTIVALLLAFLNSWLSRFFDRRLKLLRQRFNLSKRRYRAIFTWQRLSGGVAITIVWIYSLAVVVLDQSPDAVLPEVIQTVLETVVAVSFVVLLFLVIWESINGVLESLTERKDALNSSRAKTLLPLIRNIITIVLVVLSSLVILSELGVDIVPLLAGAGVLGIAVGFGAQTLVRDFITGITIIVEDLVQIGDIVNVADRQGKVSHISMRKLELRSLDGTVHTIPFSSIDIIDNLTKDFSYYMLNVGVAYRENTDDVIELLLKVDEEIRASDEFGKYILEPLDVLGVDEFADSAVVIKVRTKTQAREKWRVGREFNRRIKLAFDKHDIEIPFPHQTLYFGVDKEGGAPKFPLPSVKLDEATSVNESANSEGNNEK